MKLLRNLTRSVCYNELMRHFLHEVWRLRWMIAIPTAVMIFRGYGYLPDNSTLTLMFYKPSLACIGLVTAHIGYSQCFHYLSGSQMHAAQQDHIGEFVMRGLIYAAIILGVTLGL
jgi:hypothetical protein